MLTYIIRRLLIMPITLLGITLMVFLIARFAPGSPAQRQMDDNTMDAETREAERKKIEKKYGLNLPLHQQYFRWWRNMFTLSLQSMSWYDDGSGTLEPVYTLRRSSDEYYVRLDDGSWYLVKDPVFSGQVYEGDDEEFLQSVIEPQLDEADLPVIDPDLDEGAMAELGVEFPLPLHTVATGELVPIQSLDEDVKEERLVRATDPDGATIQVQALAWSSGGDPLYVNPEDPERPIGRRDAGGWYIISPDLAVAQSQAYPMSDRATLEPIFKSRYADLPEPDEYRTKYPVPHFAIIYGRIQTLEGEPADADSLERLTVQTTIETPVTQWVNLTDSGKWAMLWEPEAAPAPALVRTGEGEWKRIVSTTRAGPLDYNQYEQTDEAFLSRLTDEDRERLPDIENQPRVPRHVVLEGDLVDYEGSPTDRSIRRYSHPIDIFEITLGRSQQNNATVIDEMKRRLPVTLLINLLAFPFIYMIAIPVGMLMAVKRGRYFDRGANVVMLGLWSIPIVLSATLLIGYMSIGGRGLEWFPNNGLSSIGAESLPFTGYVNEQSVYVRGWLEDRIWHLVLPVFCIIYGGFAYLAKQMRAAMLDNFTMDYVRTARAKGVAFKDIVFRHVLRNSLLPLITIFATILPALIAGSVFIEKIFNIEGMGLLAFRAVQSRDFDVIQSLALIAGALNLTGLLLADICYAIADPRITHR